MDKIEKEQGGVGIGNDQTQNFLQWYFLTGTWCEKLLSFIARCEFQPVKPGV